MPCNLGSNIENHCSTKCGNCKNQGVCELQSGQCDKSGCVNGYRRPLCNGNINIIAMIWFYIQHQRKHAI